MSKNKSYNSDRIAELAELITFHKRLYYAGTPEISDAEYDGNEDELRRLAPTHPALSLVGEGTSSGKVEHEQPMLSLQKTYSKDDLMSWAKEYTLVGTLKVDGNSLSLIYENGQMTMAKTRGSGKVGEDVTQKAVWVADAVPKIDCPSRFEVRGELYCTETQFARLADMMASLGLDRPTSPRNIVAGLLGRKSNIDLARYFNFFAFDFIDETDELGIKSDMEKFKWLESRGFRIPHPRLLKKPEIVSYLDYVKGVMEEGEIGLDGAVFSYNELDLHAELGNTSHHPRYKMSFKWQGQTAVSTIKDITWATSRLGILTPVAVITPVQLSGAKITNITLHNASHVKAYNLKAGDEIEIVRSGEVIPKFLRVVKGASGNYSWPDVCPDCGSDLVSDDVRLKCRNSSGCPAQKTGAILNWIKCSEIDDLSEKRLEHLVGSKLIKSIPDLYGLSIDDFLKIPLTKEKMAAKLHGNIQKSKDITLPMFLNGIGIEGMGLTSWEKLLETYPTLSEMAAAKTEDVAAIDGFAEKTAEQIVSGLKEKRPLIDDLLAAGVKPKTTSKPTTNDGELSGKVFVLTGSLSLPRPKIEKFIKDAGGKTSSSVSKNTFAVVSDNPESNSSKMKKARQLGVKTFDENDLKKLLARDW